MSIERGGDASFSRDPVFERNREIIKTIDVRLLKEFVFDFLVGERFIDHCIIIHMMIEQVLLEGVVMELIRQRRILWMSWNGFFIRRPIPFFRVGFSTHRHCFGGQYRFHIHC